VYDRGGQGRGKRPGMKEEVGTSGEASVRGLAWPSGETRSAVMLVRLPATLKMEAICSSETSVVTQQTTRRHIPEDNTLHNHRCDPAFSFIGNQRVWRMGRQIF
jgi:hypothetical protein